MKGARGYGVSGKARPLLSCPLVAVTGQGREEGLAKGVESWERQRREGGRS